MKFALAMALAVATTSGQQKACKEDTQCNEEGVTSTMCCGRQDSKTGSIYSTVKDICVSTLTPKTVTTNTVIMNTCYS